MGVVVVPETRKDPQVQSRDYISSGSEIGVFDLPSAPEGRKGQSRGLEEGAGVGADAMAQRGELGGGVDVATET